MTEEEQRGANWMLDSIRASLRGYPDAGGDIEVMREVERITREEVGRIFDKKLRDVLEFLGREL